MEHYIYLWVDILTVIFCFAFSFHPLIRFNRHFSAFLKSAAIVGIPFIIWDIVFTYAGVWWFNDRYTTGFRIGRLPLEEWLFFLCIPFSCVFTWYVFDRSFNNLQKLQRYQKTFIVTAIVLGLGLSWMARGKIYPFSTLLLTVASLAYWQFIAKASWLASASAVYTVLLLPFLLVNGILTGTGLDQPIVNYNPADFSNIRILTVPIEDTVYGYLLFTWNVHFFKKFTASWR